MKMKYPSVNQFIENNFEYQDAQPGVDKSLDVIISCIDMVYNADECWSASDCTKEEMEGFVGTNEYQTI